MCDASLKPYHFYSFVNMDRRSLITYSGVALTGSLAGCMFLSDSPGSSRNVLIENHTENSLSGTIVVKQFDDDSDEVDGHETEPERPKEPLWEHDWEFTVDADDSTIEEDVITDPGAYYVEAECERGETDAREIGFWSSSSDHGDGVGGGQIVIILRDEEPHPFLSIGQETAD